MVDPTTPKADLRWVRPPQQARSQETLERILDAAEELVADKGFEDTPVAEVARRAGSSVGAFYTRFKDKDGLLHALYERYSVQAIATADDALRPARWDDAAIPEIVEAVVSFLVSVYRTQAGLIRAFTVRGYTDPEFAARRTRVSHHVSEGLSQLLVERQDEISHPDPVRAAAFGLTLVFSTLDSTILFGEMRPADLTMDDDDLATELTRAYLAYLGAHVSND